mmetsp:Transcript_135641/g.377785  ORF Transcript_135641/g.377785 Transcript_135641/m.377785 type:complete len:332 (-) Transcript_135641:140-1135(-)
MEESVHTPIVVEPHRFTPLRGGYDPDPLTIVGSCAVIFCFLMTFFVSSLAPNEYGLAQNFLSGVVDVDVYRGGLHLLGPLKGFVKFPAAQVTLEFSKRSGDRPPIMTRTGADPRDPDSGGQPIGISCALQFVFVQSTLPDVYLSLGRLESATERFLLLSGNVVSNTAQEFTPQDFWGRRNVVANRILTQLNSTLWNECSVAVTRFEFIKVTFAKTFEDAITSVQVAEQQRVVNEYDQQVQQVAQSIQVMKANNDAAIANITAGAGATAKEICAVATRDAFAVKQGTKAKGYAELKNTLGLNHEQMQDYFKIKSVQGQSMQGPLVVRVEGVL